jgi:hypothetical protein
VCLANQVGGEEAAEKPFLDERLATREANEKMVLEPLAYSAYFIRHTLVTVWRNLI